MQHLKAAPLSMTLALVCLLLVGVAHAQQATFNEACVNTTLTHKMLLDGGGQLKISIKCEGEWFVQLLVQAGRIGDNIATILLYDLFTGTTPFPGIPESGEVTFNLPFALVDINIVERKLTLTNVNGDTISLKINFD